MHLKGKHRTTFWCKLRLHKCPYSRVMTNLARTPKSAIFGDFAKGGPRENAQKSRPTIRASKTPWRKWHHLLISMHLKGKHRTTFWCKLRLHKCPYSRVMTNLARTPKSAIFGDFAKGGPRENAQKSRPTIRASKTPWRKWHHLLISMHLKGKHRTTFWCKLRLHKCPYSRVMTNLARTPKSAIFGDFAKGGPRENAQKSRPTIRASKTPWRKWHHLLISMHLKGKHRTTFWCKLRLHKCPYSRVMTNLARTPKSAIFGDFAKGGPRENAQKSRPTIRASKTPWRKWHHLLISMHLKGKHRTTFWCKLRLHKCPYSRVMTNLARTPKSAIFGDFAKGGPRENAQKSRPTIRASKTPWRKWHHLLISMHLKGKHRTTFWCKLRLHKCPYSRVMTNLARTPKSAIFGDFAKGGPRENAQKSRPTIRASKTPWRKWHHLLISMHLKGKHRTTFWCKLRLHKCPYSRVMTNLARTPKSAIFGDFAKGGPRENAQKSRPTIRASKTPWRKWHHLLISMHLKGKHRTTFWCKLRLHKCPYSRVMTNLARTPKSAIFGDFAKGGPRENAQKSRPTIRASKTPWRKWHHLLISMHLKGKHRTTFWCKLRLHKCPYSRVMTNLARTPKSAIFGDFAKGGPRENAQKSRPTIRASKTPWRKWHHLLISMHLKGKHRTTFWCKLRLHKCPYSRVMTNLARTPKSAIFGDFAKGGPRENAQKSRPTIRASKTPWRKWHHLLISMHLKGKHRTTFWCKLRLHKCPYSRVMTNLARTPKSAIFGDFAKGGPRENAQKSRPTIRASKTPWRKWHHLLISMHLKGKHRTTFWCKLRLHKCPYSRVMTNLARTPKSAIFGDFAKGGPRENAQKSRPTIRASKTPWRKWHHLLISMDLKGKHRTTFWCKLRLHKCPYSRVMTNLARTPKSAIFGDFAKGGPRENAQKSRPTIRASKTPWRKWHHLLISMHLKGKHRTTFWCKLRLHKCPYSRVMTNLARTPKSAIFWDFAKKGPWENAQKSRPTIRASQTPWRKWHHLLISMHLKGKHRTTFWCKLRLHKCPYSRVMTNLARTPKSAIFGDFAKGGPRENAQKSRPTIRASKTPWRKWHHLLISMHLKGKHRTTFWCKLRLHKCPYSRVMTNLARTPKSAIFGDFAKGGPRENAQKSRPTIRASKTPWRKWHHLLISMHLKGKHRTTFWCKLRLHKCPYSRVMTNLARTPKSAIFGDFAKGGPRENAQKSRPTIRASKTPWRKWHHLLISMHLKGKHRKTFWCKLRLHKCPYSRVMTNLARTPKSAIFGDFAKGGPRENAQKSRPTIRASKTPWRKWHHLLISMHLKGKHRTKFWCKLRLHKCPYSRVMTNLERTPKSAIFGDFAKGGPRENAQKSRPTIRASKTPWRKWHHLLISMHLKGKHRTTFWCKLRLHKCPYSRVMTNLARTPKSAIFGDFAKGGPRENAQKSRPTIRASKTPWRKWHHLLISMDLKGKHRTTFWCKLRLHKCPYSRVMTNLARTPKSAIFGDFAKGGPRENAQKSRPTIRASKTPWCKWHHLLISMDLKDKHRTTFWCKLRLHKCPYSRVMTNLARTPKSAIFWDFAKGGPRENAQKSRPTIRASKTPWRKWHHLLISMHLKGKHRTTFWCKLRLHKCPYSRVMTNLARTPKSAIFGDFAKGGPRENAQKSRPTIRASKTPWRKWHHLLISMHLKGKHRTTFWCKLRLHKCPYSRVMTNLARTPKSAIFGRFCQGGTKGKCSKK